MFCRYCGKEIDNDAVFCKYCGKSLTNDSTNENRSNAGSNTGNTGTTYQQRNYERMRQSQNAQWDKVLAQNFNTDSNRGVIMATSFHGAMRFPASILVIITAVFVIVMSFIVLVSYRPHRALYVISWILFIAAIIYFIICTMRGRRAVFAVTDKELHICTWLPSQKLTIPLAEIDEINMNIVPFYRNEYGDLNITANGQTYFYHQIYKPAEFRDVLTDQVNKAKQ
ncbi:MAG: zinc ribbon domain-containing protein [Lachnospiraceae bacterium]|nr:zinc ribbon domain-containing protein [Lachnospiraceae bacterium]